MDGQASKDGIHPKAAPAESTADEKPLVPQKAPYKVELKEGETYYYCTCGKSKNLPFCDGAHQCTKFTPKVSPTISTLAMPISADTRTTRLRAVPTAMAPTKTSIGVQLQSLLL